MYSLLAVGLLWRLVRFAVAMPIWGDEAMLGLNVTSRSYRDLLLPLDSGQVSPLGFLWALRFVFDRLGVSDYTTRLPALLAGMLALLLLCQWARSVVQPHAAVIATGIASVSYYLVRHGVELKPYAFDLLATVVILWLGTRYLVSRRSRWLLALIVAAPICSVASYPQIFIAAAVGCALLWSAREATWTNRLLIAAYCVTAAVSFVFVLRVCGAAQYRTASAAMLQSYWHAAFPPANPLRFLVWFVQIHTGNLFAYPIGGKNGASIVTVALFCIGLGRLWRQTTISCRLLLFTPFLFTFVAAALRLYPYGESARISQHLAPIIIVVAAAGVAVLIDRASTPNDWQRRFHLAGLLLLVIGVVGMISNMVAPYKTKADQQLRADVRRLRADAKNAPLLVLQSVDATPPGLRWYLQESPGVSYAADVSTEKLATVDNAYVINCDPNEVQLDAKLRRLSHMKPSTWISEDLQLGPRENGLSRLEVVHLVR